MTRDQFLAEMMGKCWHEDKPNTVVWLPTAGGMAWVCSKCGNRFMMRDYPNFSTSPADILALQQWVMAQEWWPEFHEQAHEQFWKVAASLSLFTKYLITNLPDLVAEFRGWRND